MNVTVSGASGFIGRKLLPLLEARGHAVHILGRKPKAGLPASVRFSLWEPDQGQPPVESLASADAVIHLAGEPVAQRWSPEVKRRIRASRSVGTRNLVNAIGALQQKPSILISASAVGYYGDRADETLTEKSKPGTGFLPEVCVEWETEARAAERLGLRVAMPRIGIVLGRDGGALDKMLPPFQWGVGGRLGSGKQWMPWIHLDDLCDLFVWLLENDRARGPFNASAPNPVTNADFTRELGRALRRPAIFPVPRAAIRALYGEMADILFYSQRAVPAAAQALGFEFRHPEIFASLKDLLS
ncbi:MAG: TIGR01777 family oxidoreductase [Bryobacteraceae bacterium]